MFREGLAHTWGSREAVVQALGRTCGHPPSSFPMCAEKKRVAEEREKAVREGKEEADRAAEEARIAAAPPPEVEAPEVEAPEPVAAATSAEESPVVDASEVEVRPLICCASALAEVKGSADMQA